MKLLRSLICLMIVICVTLCSSFVLADDAVPDDEEWQKILSELGISEDGTAVENKTENEKLEDKSNTVTKAPESDRIPYMNEYLDSNEKNAGTDMIELLPQNAYLSSEKAADIHNSENGEGAKAIYLTDESDCSWNFDISSAGRYYLRVKYSMINSNGVNPTRNLLIDGELPFFEAEGICFYRTWVTDGEIKIDSNNDEIRPGVIQKQQWNESDVKDAVGYYGTPLILWLSEGCHTLTLQYVNEFIAIEWIQICPYKEPIPYKAKASNKSDKPTLLEFEAEKVMTSRNDATIRIESNGDPATTPAAIGYKVFNCVGGYRWRKGNQAVDFEIDVPKNGYYIIGMRVSQTWNDGLPSYRTVLIDGKVPFSELLNYRFNYGTDWQTEILKSGDEEAYEIYLEKGKHTFTLSVTLGEFTPIIQSLYDNMSLLSDIIMDITKLTGTEPDPNYDYQFFKYLPNTKTDMEKLLDDLKELCKQIHKISGKSTSLESTVDSVASQLEKMLANPFLIAKHYSQLTDAQTTLGDWYLTAQEQPLLLDKIFVCENSEIIPTYKSSLFSRINSTAMNFFISFVKDYNNIGSILDENAEYKDTLKIWISRGSEWAEIIKSMADEDFTQKSGIRVNINTVPSSQLNTGSANVLMLSIISGKAPDVAMGVSASSPVEFAIRDTVVDFSSFPDYSEVKNRFLSEIITPFCYNGGVFALPETMNFSVLFYRKDIFEKYGLQIPDTYDELYHFTLPTLYRNGMEYYQPQTFSQFLYPNKGAYYTKDGFHSALDSFEAYTAFKEYTDMFTQYGCPVMASFFNRFRSGKMPIGIGNYSFYIQLSTSAPELVGKWGIAPLPGKTDENGNIDRSTDGVAAECDIILKNKNNDKKKYESAWEFLKWWSNKSVQQKYSREIEALQGVQARWNTANVDAFYSLAWSKEDIKVINEQLSWTSETPVVLGGYYTSRYVLNAFTDVVISGNSTARDALEDAVEKINRELKNKQEEYGIFKNDKEGKKAG